MESGQLSVRKFRCIWDKGTHGSKYGTVDHGIAELWELIIV